MFAELSKKEKTTLAETGTGEGKQFKKDERQKKATAGGGQKGGAGRGGRESGTKKTKNKYRDRVKGNREDDDDCNVGHTGKMKQQELPFLSQDEVIILL